MRTIEGGMPMRVIQAGLGGFGRSWAELIRAAPGIELVAVAEPAPAARQWAERTLRLSAGAIFASLDGALARTNAEAVVIVTPPETHAALATAALTAGRHVLLEKPLATNLADAQALIDRAAGAGCILMVSQNYRYHPPARAAQGIVAVGDIGALLAVRIECRRDTRRLWPPDNFRYRMRHPYLLDMAIHHFDLLRAVTGRNVRWLQSRTWPVPDSPFQHEPAMSALLELEGGVPVIYDGTWACHGPETPWAGDWEIVGDAGRLRWRGGIANVATGEITLERWGVPSGPVPLPALDATDRAGTLAAFQHAVAAGAEPETSARDNIHSLSVVLGCLASIERSRPVDLPRLLAGAGQDR